MVNEAGGESMEVMRRDSPILQEGGLIVEMEREGTESYSSSVLGFCLYPIDPDRLSNQCRISVDRCTPKLPR